MATNRSTTALRDGCTRRARHIFVRMAVTMAAVLLVTLPPSWASRSHAQPGATTLRLAAELGGVPTAAAADGGFVYLAVHSRIVVLDPGAAPGAPPIAVSAPIGDRIDGLDVVDGVAVTTGAYLHVLDVSDPRAIVEQGRLSLQTVRGGPAIIVGDQAWINRRLSGIHRVSIADPTRPRSLGHWRPAATVIDPALVHVSPGMTGEPGESSGTGRSYSWAKG
jgi:hypothetical protein